MFFYLGLFVPITILIFCSKSLRENSCNSRQNLCALASLLFSFLSVLICVHLWLKAFLNDLFRLGSVNPGKPWSTLNLFFFRRPAPPFFGSTLRNLPSAL